MTTRRERNAREFARAFRAALVDRACRRAVRRLGRSLTAEEHRCIGIAIRAVISPRRRAVV
jgi:hypothetical protein